jgi:hypothetical protein
MGIRTFVDFESKMLMFEAEELNDRDSSFAVEEADDFYVDDFSDT